MAHEAHKAASGALWLFFAQLALVGSGYAVVVILARELGPEVYGVYGLIYSVLVGVELIGRLGIPQAASKLIAEGKEQPVDLEGTALTLTGLVYCGLFLLFWVFAPLMARLFHLTEGTYLLRLAAVDIPFFGYYMMCSHIINGRRRFGVESTGIAIYAATKTFGIGALYVVGISVAGAFIVNIAASVAGLIFVALHLSPQSFRPTLALAGSIFRLALPIALLGLGAQVLLNLDLWVLGTFSETIPENSVGLYNAAGSVAKIPNIVFFVMMAVLIPSMSNALANNDERLARRYVMGAGQFLVMVLLPGCALIAVEAKGVMELIYGERYTDAALSLAILVFAFGFFYTSLMTFAGILIAMGRPLFAAGITLYIIPLQLIASIVLIKTWGATGAALSAIFASGIGAWISGYIVHKRMGPLLVPVVTAKVLLATAIMILIAHEIPSEGLMLLVEGVAVFALYVFILRLFRALDWEDLKVFVPASLRRA